MLKHYITLLLGALNFCAYSQFSDSTFQNDIAAIFELEVPVFIHLNEQTYRLDSAQYDDYYKVISGQLRKKPSHMDNIIPRCEVQVKASSEVNDRDQIRLIDIFSVSHIKSVDPLSKKHPCEDQFILNTGDTIVGKFNRVFNDYVEFLNCKGRPGLKKLHITEVYKIIHFTGNESLYYSYGENIYIKRRKHKYRAHAIGMTIGFLGLSGFCVYLVQTHD